jgi:hypothetical protein
VDFEVNEYKIASKLFSESKTFKARRSRMLTSKKRPDTLFEQVFFDIREKAKEQKKKEGQKAVAALEKKLKADLQGGGIIVQSASVKLGKFRGSQFVTSAKLFLTAKKPFEDENDKRLQKLLTYLQQTYSPKYKLKSVKDGVAVFNVR